MNAAGVSLRFQSDGNLVLFAAGGAVAWTSETYNTSPAFLCFETDGNIVLAQADGNVVWQSGSVCSANAYAVIQQDGNMVVYDYHRHGRSVVWATGTSVN